MSSQEVPASTDVHVEELSTYISPVNETTDFLGSVSDSFTVVLGSLVKALSTLFTEAGILLVLIIAGIGFMFVRWAIRLIHLRGR